MMMLAQIGAPDPLELGKWLGCLAATLIIYNQFMKAKDHGKKTEVNATVEGKTQFVPKDQFENFAAAHSRELSGLHSKVGGVERGAAAEIKAIRQEMHDMERRLNDTGEARAGRMHERLNEVAEEMPSRVVSLLKNTGAIE